MRASDKMPPTRKLSRSKQQTEQSSEAIAEKTDANESESTQASNDNELDSKKEPQIDEINDDDKNRRKGRSRRSTASSVQLDNDLNENETTTSKKSKTIESQETIASPRKLTQRQQSPEKKEIDSKLRRRDKLKGTDRYSPEIHEPVRRSKRPLSFPSTSASQNKYINYESFDDEQSLSTQSASSNTCGSQLLPTKKMLLKRSASTMNDEQNSTSTNESKTYLVNLKQEENELILVMRDGRTLKIEKPTKRQKTSKEGDEDYEMESVEEEDDNDSDYDDGKSTKSNKRRSTTKNTRSKTNKQDNSQHQESDEVSAPATGEKKVQATGIKMTKQIRKATKQQLMSSKLADETRTTRITTPTGSGKTVTFITTPKSVTVTPANTYLKSQNTYVKRNYGSNAKYLNEIPDLNECILEEVNPDYEILPDKILLVNSDLPLDYSLNTINKEDIFLFTQIISQMSDGFKCLVCSIHATANSTTTTPLSKTPPHTFKEEEELVEHYKQYHELNVEQQSAKFSEETVFVCLPKAIIGQISDEETSSSLILDAPCQYCGDEQKLATVDDMKEHYKNAHLKDIKIVEQEEILEMYEVLSCSLCQEVSKDFQTHYKHMKEKHKMQTYICKQCPFFSMVAHRLVTHYRAKHLMSNKNQNLQCSFCNGILIGTDRMNKHIMTSHCVQTGEKEYSCMLCLQPCEKSDQLLAHSYQCQRKYNEALAATHKQEKIPDQQAIEGLNAIGEIEHKFKCFLCDRSFKEEETLVAHLNHVHTKWTSTVIVNDTFLMVQHKDGKTDLMPNKNAKNESEQININDLPTNKELEEIGAKTQYGYYCSKCECVIKIYQLFYLHMHNFHRMTKQFECKITSCKKTFKTHESFKEHIDQSKHPQKSVIEDPLLSIACHNCDSYFIDNKDIETHLLSDEHYNKVSKNADRSGMKSEARNYKCKTCHTWFGLFDSFLFHMENESHKHGCPHCGLHFALPSSRRAHIQSIHSDRAEICELCSEKQGTKERLFAHLVTHNLVFECNKCMRKFYQREQLNNHMETHGESLNCPWPKCERKVNRTALSNHIRQHKIENSLKCCDCEKLFQTKNQLLSHVEIHNAAEKNAKAIIASATSNASKIGKVGQINSNQIHKPKIGQIQLNTTSSASSSQPVETTLISITTASTNKQRTYGNRSLSNSANKLNNSNLVSNKAQQIQQIVSLPVANKYQIEKINTNSAGKIICFTCNQLFTNHEELSEHKCSINKPVVTITKESSNVYNKQIDLNESNQNETLLFSANEKLNGEPCYILTDGVQDVGSFKHVILQPTAVEEKSKKKIITTPSTTTSSSSHNRFMESNKKTYDFQNRQKKNYLKNNKPAVPATNQLLLSDGAFKTTDHQQIYIETQSPINQQTQLILTDPSQIAALNSGNIELLDSNTVSTIQALIQQDGNQLIQTTGNEVLQIPIDQHQIIMQEQPIVTGNSTPSTDSQTQSGTITVEQQQNSQPATSSTEQQQTFTEQIPDTNQYIMIQQPDGQCVQICIPEGMDVEEVIKNLNFTWQTEEPAATTEQQTTQFLDTQQILEQQQLIADQQNQLIAVEQQQHQMLTDTSQIQQLNLDQTTVEQLQSGEQQVIYLPMNEDGTAIALDQESLNAMLTNGEIPIIVSSSN